MEYNFLTQLVRDPIRGGATLDLLFTNIEEPVENVVVRSHGQRDHKIEFFIFAEVSSESACTSKRPALASLGLWLKESLERQFCREKGLNSGLLLSRKS